MTRRFAPFIFLIAVVAVGTSTSTGAAETSNPPAESLLSSDSVAYLRFDGLGSHHDAYNRTILAELLHNEFAPLTQDLTKRIFDLLGPQFLSERLLAGVEPDQLLKFQNANKQLPHLLEYLQQNGFVVGVELIDPLQLRFQVTIVFPGGGRTENRSALFGAFRLLGLLTGLEVEDAKIDERTVLRLNTPAPVKVACWLQGEHVVLTVGSEDVDYTLELVDGRRQSLIDNPLYLQLAEFDRYETIACGFLDLERLTKIAETRFPPAAAISQQLGLTGLKSVRFHVGFQKRHVRSTVVLDMPGEREGLLQLLTSPNDLDLDKLPPLPPDTAWLMASRIDITAGYSSIVEAIEVGIQAASPSSLPDFQRQMETLASGLDDGFFDALGSTIVLYNAPSEGPLNFGLAVAIEVKDEEKLKKSLETMIRSLTATTGADVALNEQDYQGAILNTVHVGVQGFPFLPSYTIHDGWLVVSLYPQPVQGFIFRSDGKHDVWKLPAIARKVIQEETNGDARLSSIFVSDPRPTVETILSLAPFFVKLITSFSGAASDFDISLIPHAQSVTELLTHNVSVVVDDGTSVRIESYSSMPMPIQLSGLETYAYAIGLSFFAPFGF